VALWREALLCRAVLAEVTKAYSRHPQVSRFREMDDPLRAINLYLTVVCAEGLRRGFKMDTSKLPTDMPTIHVEQRSEDMMGTEHKAQEGSVAKNEGTISDDHPFNVRIEPNIQPLMKVSVAQFDFEWKHLLLKLYNRNRDLWSKLRCVPPDERQPHPLFRIDWDNHQMESWERGEPVETLPNAKKALDGVALMAKDVGQQPNGSAQLMQPKVEERIDRKRKSVSSASSERRDIRGRSKRTQK